MANLPEFSEANILVIKIVKNTMALTAIFTSGDRKNVHPFKNYPNTDNNT